MDGTTICDEWAHMQAKASIIKSMGDNCTINLEDDIGRSNRKFWAKVLKNMGLEGDVEALVVRQFTEVLRLVRSTGQRESPGLKDLLKFCHDTGRKTALCTGSDEWFVTDVLEYLGIRDCYDVLITSEDAKNLKPAPDVYIAALKKAGISPEFAIGIEDSTSGCIAVHGSGMPCIGYLAGGENRQDLSAAEYRVNHMSEVIDLLRQIDPS